MIPRITQKEAAYLAAVLSSNLEVLNQKLSDVKELERDMSLCIFNLKHRVQPIYDDAGYFKELKIVGDQEASLARIASAG
jgi:hypothetical protein